MYSYLALFALSEMEMLHIVKTRQCLVLYVRRRSKGGPGLCPLSEAGGWAPGTDWSLASSLASASQLPGVTRHKVITASTSTMRTPGVSVSGVSAVLFLLHTAHGSLMSR